jgi:ribosomal protein S4
MIFKNKNKFKPFYKKFIKFRENIQNRRKILQFKKQKWNRFINFYKRRLKWYKKFKPFNQNQYLVSKYPNRYTSYKKRYKNTLLSYKTFNLYYGDLKKSTLRNKVNIVKNNNYKILSSKILELFEKRLDVVLYRSKFCHSLRSAHQIISHKKVLVNNIITKNKSRILTKGDMITIKQKDMGLIKSNIKQTELWPIPPKHLLINYKTMQIILLDIKHNNLSVIFPLIGIEPITLCLQSIHSAN